MKKILKIGTRDSQLALWQAQKVQQALADLGQPSQIVAVKSQGDLVLDVPLYEMGITGIFTKVLDVELLRGNIDLAVHSMKDVPTRLPQGIVQAAVLPRANVFDLLVLKEGASSPMEKENATIATGSLRRKAQWLHQFPTHTVENLRGNVNTRLQKLAENPWDGAIFAAAGLERLGKKPRQSITLNWMLPAPAQGAICAVTQADNLLAKELLSQINDPQAALCAQIERDFLRFLEGGCSAPIGALAQIIGNEIHFEGNLCSPCGKTKISVERTAPLGEHFSLAQACAEYVFTHGGREILASLPQKK